MYLALAAFVALVAPLPDAEPVSTSAASLLAFKNGYGFVEERGVAQLTDGWFRIPEAPQASFGLLWISAREAGFTVDRAITRIEETKDVRTEDISLLDDLIAENEGAAVSLAIAEGEGTREVTGVLGKPIYQSVTAVPSGVQPGVQGWPSAIAPPLTPPPSKPVPSGLEFVELVGPDGASTFIPRHTIRTIRFAEAPKRRKTTVEDACEPRMYARVMNADAPASGEVPVSVTYMRKGVSWLPSYSLNLLSEDRARIRLDATLINDAADLEGGTVRFVVGVPSFILQDMLSPTSVRMAWEGLSPYFARSGGDAGGYSAIMMTQMSSVASFRAGEAAVQPASDPMAGYGTGSGAREDLYVYSVDDVTLPAGGRGLFRVMEEEVPYEDIYLLTLEDDTVSHYEQMVDRIEDPDLALSLRRPQVWHAVRLTNTTEGPWTTGAATTIGDSMPIGQALLTFTPPGQDVDLKLTVAPDVACLREEYETGRQRNALTINGHEWLKVSLTGKLSLSNASGEDKRLIARREIRGTFTETSEGGEARVTLSAAYSVNPTSETVWDLTLPAGGTAELTYGYYVYIR